MHCHVLVGLITAPGQDENLIDSTRFFTKGPGHSGTHNTFHELSFLSGQVLIRSIG